jgi:hypothetical protein
MKLTIHPAAFMFGALLLCVTWLALRTVPPAPFSAASQASRASAPPRTQRQEIEVDPATLKRYAGEYRIADGSSVFISLDGDRLFALVPNAPPIELFPFSANEFFAKEFDAEVAFDARTDGPAPRFTVRSPAGTIAAKRSDTKPR